MLAVIGSFQFCRCICHGRVGISTMVRIVHRLLPVSVGKRMIMCGGRLDPCHVVCGKRNM